MKSFLLREIIQLSNVNLFHNEHALCYLILMGSEFHFFEREAHLCKSITSTLILTPTSAPSKHLRKKSSMSRNVCYFLSKHIILSW